MFPQFGFEANPEKYLVELGEFIAAIEKEDGEQVDSITFEIMRQRTYQKAYQITGDEDAAADPLAHVTVRPKEDVYTFGAVEQRLWRYKTYNVKEVWGCSIDEFLSYPRHVVEYMLKLCGEEARKQNPDLQKTLTSIQKEEKKQRNSDKDDR